MIAAIIIVSYISFLSCLYGSIFFTVFRYDQEKDTALSFFTGFGVLTALATIYSCFAPLSGLFPICFVSIPAFVFLIWKPDSAKSDWFFFIAQIRSLSVSVKVVLLTGWLLFLVMFPYTVSHPDTLIYHAQLIQWIELYSPVPGIANLHRNNGLQSSWFTISALFSFRALNTHAVTYSNIAVILWFWFFGCFKLEKSYHSGTKGSFILWLLLLVTALVSYTQIRLTITSASPDFIVCLYTWLTIYIFRVKEKQKISNEVLLFFLCFLTVSLKPSAIPILLLVPIVIFYSKNKWAKSILCAAVISIIFLAPLLYRNYVSSGYLLYPSAWPDFFSPDWKLPKDQVQLISQYINTYAKLKSSSSPAEIQSARNLQLQNWLPIWWHFLSYMDKLIMISCALTIGISPFIYRRLPNTREKATFLILIFSVLFWFIAAPDPRFGYGFIIPLIGIGMFQPPKLFNPVMNFNRHLLLYILAGFIFIYSGYRITHFFFIRNFFVSSGLQPSSYLQHSIGPIKVTVPTNTDYCAGSPIPCTTHSKLPFMNRGQKISDGFKPLN